MKALVKRPELYAEPEKGHPPAPWVRGLLILTCTGVSFAHGSNDGQKGMGLIMLILIGVVPGIFALDLGMNAKDYQAIVTQNASVGTVLHTLAGTDPVDNDEAANVINAYLKTAAR